MRLLFSTSDPIRVGLVESMLQKANIQCEVRQPEPDNSGLPGYPEVWVRDGAEYEYAALIFCNWVSPKEEREVSAA